MGVEIVDALTPDLREAVFRFRYEIYVREMQRPQKDADHARARIEDALDATAELMVARDTATGAIVGTIRANVLGDGRVGTYESLYGVGGLGPAARAHTSITTRLMVERSKRGTLVAVRLAQALFRRALERRIATDYCDCNAHLVPFFERLGYRPLGLIAHPEYGLVTLMRLDIEDSAFLRRIGSPLAAADVSTLPVSARTAAPRGIGLIDREAPGT